MSARYTIIILGRGQLALAMEKDFQRSLEFECRRLDAMVQVALERVEHSPSPILVQASSASRLPSMIEYCEEHTFPLIVASTGQDSLLPFRPTFPIIKAPNLLPEILVYRMIMPRLGKLMQQLGVKVTIEESHQRSKRTLPGTAVAFANDLGIPEDEIESTRNTGDQRRNGVPEEFLGAHAYHTLTFEGPTCKSGIWMKVHGRPYAAGLKLLAPKIYPKNGEMIPAGVYEAHELLFAKL